MIDIFTANLAFTLPSVFFDSIIVYFIFRNRIRSPRGKKGWAIVIFATWLICAIWSSIISGDAFGKLLGGEGLLIIPFVVAVLMVLIVSRPINEAETKPFKLNRILGWIAGVWLAILWLITFFSMLTTDMEKGLFAVSSEMFVSRIMSLILITLILIASLYIFAFLFEGLWIRRLVRFLEWFFITSLAFTCVFGIFNYVYKCFAGGEFFIGPLLFDAILLLGCFFIVGRLLKHPVSKLIFQGSSKSA